MDLPKVEGTQIRGKVYHLNLRIKPVGTSTAARATSGSLRTSDPQGRPARGAGGTGELLEKEQERARQAEVEDLIAQLTPEQRRAYDAAGRLGRARGVRSRTPRPGRHATPALVPAETASRYSRCGGEGRARGTTRRDRIDDDWPLGGALTILPDDHDDYEQVFTTGDLFEEYAAKFEPGEIAAMRQCVRLFGEFHGDVAYDELTIGHLDEFIVAAHRLPADMMARRRRRHLRARSALREMVAWTVATVSSRFRRPRAVSSSPRC
ncbi:MAG: hypothetical protein R3D59_12890 [Paracoccaceae bacterium]